MTSRLVVCAWILAAASAAAAPPARRADARLERALAELVGMPGGPPGVIAVVQRGRRARTYGAGLADVRGLETMRDGDAMRIASVAKAFSGAVALALVSQGTLSLDDTIGARLPDLPASWHPVTLRQLLNHTSGLPDFIHSDGFVKAFVASPTAAPPPRALLRFVEDRAPIFTPGARYAYSNSDNIAVGLMIEAATGRAYEDVLAAQVFTPLGLAATSLPRGIELPPPFMHGYALEPPAPLDDVSGDIAAGWAWASGGIVSTPDDLNRFIRGYVGGALLSRAVRRQQFSFVPRGGSEPTGPGRNAAGLALFRYRTRCGTVFGHTGNTFGYTQFAAASRSGRRSVTMSITLQRTQESEGEAGAVFRALRRAQVLAVCAALAAGG